MPTETEDEKRRVERMKAMGPEKIAPLVCYLASDLSAGISGQTTVNGAFPSGLPFSATFGSRVDDIGTARLRLGYAWGRFLPYLMAGFTYGVIETSYTFAMPGFFSSAASTAVRSGYFLMSDAAASASNMPSTRTSQLRQNISTNSSTPGETIFPGETEPPSPSGRAQCIISAGLD